MKRLVYLAAFQVLTILGWASYHEYVWATAPTFRIPLRPRDPFDLLRGRYFVLNPLDSAIDTAASFLSAASTRRFLGDEGYFAGRALVGFCPVDEVFRVCALARVGEEPQEGPARYWSHAFVQITKREAEWSVIVDLGLRRFFIPNRLTLPGRENAPGWQLEVSYRPGLEPLPRRLFFEGKAIDLR